MWFLISSLALAQTFDEPSRWHVSSEVGLPAVMWMAADRNTEARMVAWELELLLDCPAAEQLRRGSVASCVVSDAAVAASPHPGDVGRLAPILAELDTKLTDAVVEIRLGPEGDVRAVALLGLATRSRRMTAMQENLRLMVSRAMVGFDQPVPDRDVDAGWSQRGGWVSMMPAGSGTLAGGKIVHQRTGTEDGAWQITSSGRVTLEPHSGQEWPPMGGQLAVFRQDGALPRTAWDQLEGSVGMVALFDTETESTAVVQPDGALIERSWTAVGWPTPSSRVATAAKGYPYRQSGTVVRLGPDDQVDLGATVETVSPDPTPSAIQVWESLGVDW